MSTAIGLFVVDVLVRLSRNWHIAKNRLERAQKQRDLREGELNRRIHRLNLLTAMRASDKRKEQWKRCMERHVARLNDVAVDERIDIDFHLHPFPDFVERLARWTGAKKETIRSAAKKGFSGYPKLVAKLEQLNGQPRLQRLYQQLAAEHPAIAAKCEIGFDDAAGAAKRRGRKKADYKTEQGEAALAAAWQRARDSGVSKPEFAKDTGMKPAEFEQLLGRVRHRNSRADK